MIVNHNTIDLCCVFTPSQSVSQPANQPLIPTRIETPTYCRSRRHGLSNFRLSRRNPPLSLITQMMLILCSQSPVILSVDEAVTRVCQSYRRSVLYPRPREPCPERYRRVRLLSLALSTCWQYCIHSRAHRCSSMPALRCLYRFPACRVLAPYKCGAEKLTNFSQQSAMMFCGFISVMAVSAPCMADGDC